MSKSTTAMYLVVALLGAWQEPGGARAQPSAGSARAELIERALVGKDRDAFETLVAQGSAIVPEVEAYQSNQSFVVKRTAFALLIRIPEAAPTALVRALRSPDEELKCTALQAPAHLLSDERVRGAWIDCFLEPLPYTNAHDLGYNALVHLPSDVRTALADELLPKLLRSLDTFDGSRSITMVKIIGQFARPGDETALRRLAELRRDSVPELAPRLQRRNDGEYNKLVRGRLVQALDFAEANIGDDAAFQRYANAVLAGDPEARAGRLKFLGRFRPVARALQLARKLLDDRTPLQYMAPAGAPSPVYRRACDFAVDAVAAWSPGFPVKTHESFVYSDEQLAQAREWLRGTASDR